MNGSDLLLGAYLAALHLWPAFLLGALALAFLSLRLRGTARAVLVTLAALLALPGLAAGAAIGAEAWRSWRDRAEHARTHTRLTEPRVVDGIALPPGAVIQWSDASRTRMESVRLNPAAEVLGVRARYLLRFGDDRWSALLEDPATVDGWPCEASHASLTTEGRLLSCTLARATPWKGWDLPARTEITLHPGEHRMSVVVPVATPLEAPGIGRLPWFVTLYDDGSLAEARYARDAPLRVGDHLLWDDVRWRYGTGTYGAGRARVPVSVSGLPMGAEDPTRDEARRVVLPLTGS